MVTTVRTDAVSSTSPRRQAVTAVAGAWLVVGVFVDGWAHLSRPGLETFFTPWHAVLYSGAAALFGWLLVSSTSSTRRDRAWAIAAALIFGAGGAGDLLWHEVFGVETGLDALVSPTHLLLMLGGLVGLTAPLRESRPEGAQGFRAALPVLTSVALAAALGSFFLLYASPFAQDAATVALTAIPEGSPGHQEAEAPAMAGLAAYLVSTVVVVVPALILRNRGMLPFGGITLLVTTVATLSAAVTEFEQPAAPLAAAAAGVVADLLARSVRRLPEPAHAPVLGAAIPFLLWSAQLAALALTAGVRWPAELVVGVVVLSALFGAALGLLATSRTSPADATAGLAAPAGRRALL